MLRVRHGIIMTGCFLFLFMLPSVFAAEPIRLAIVDFAVQSDNAAYKYLGKGFAEFTAIELAKSKSVIIIEREKRNKALEELAFSLSDAADAAKQLKIGQLLAAQYLVMGSIFELGGRLIVTFDVIDVQKGFSIFTDKIDAEPTAYNYITASLAAKILGCFSLAAPEAVVASAAQPVQKPAEAAVKFSNAIDAMDRKDTQAARADLTAAQKLDPQSDAIRIYLSKLTVNTTKFQITTDAFYSFQNPAYLGMLKTDRLYASFNAPPSATNGPYTGIDGLVLNNAIPYWNCIGLPDGRGYEYELSVNLKGGYQFPVGDTLGMDVEGFFSVTQDNVWNTSSLPITAGSWNLVGGGAIIGIGYRLMDSLSIGMGLAPYWSVMTGTFCFAGNAGILYSNESFMFDSRVGYGTGTHGVIDPVSITWSGESVGVPVYNENTFTWISADTKAFVILKQTNEVSLAPALTYFFCRLLPAFEYFFSDWFSLRAGIEGSFAYFSGAPTFGYGAVIGTTFRVIPIGMDFDLNASYNLRPSRNVPGLLYPDFVVLLGVSFNDLLISRR